MTIHVTNSTGLVLSSVQVTVQGPLARDGSTGEDGVVRFTNLRAGTYRLRFAREGFVTLEREVTLRTATEMITVDVTLNAAPPPPKPPEPPPVVVAPPPAPKLPPPGNPKTTAIPDFLDRNLIRREPRKESPLGCAGSGSSTLYQLREAWTSHVHETEDEWLYVVAGEGILRVGAMDQPLQPGTFSLIPRTTQHALQPKGRNPLIVISIMSGAPCESVP